MILEQIYTILSYILLSTIFLVYMHAHAAHGYSGEVV